MQTRESVRTTRLHIQAEGAIYFGTLTYPAKLRFSDILCIKYGQGTDQFMKYSLPLRDVEELIGEKTRNTYELLFLSVSRIVYAFDREQRVGDEKLRRQAEAKEKYMIEAILTDNTVFVGEAIDGINSLNSPRPFINLTNVAINRGTKRLPFVALNKRYIKAFRSLYAVRKGRGAAEP